MEESPGIVTSNRPPKHASRCAVIFRQYPIAVQCPQVPDLKCANLFFVRNSQVDFLSTTEDLKFFFAANLNPAPTHDTSQATACSVRYSRLAVSIVLCNRVRPAGPPHLSTLPILKDRARSDRGPGVGARMEGRTPGVTELVCHQDNLGRLRSPADAYVGLARSIAPAGRTPSGITTPTASRSFASHVRQIPYGGPDFPTRVSPLREPQKNIEPRSRCQDTFATLHATASGARTHRQRKLRELPYTFDARWDAAQGRTTALVESTINHVVSRRFVKKQQMQWTLKGAHFVLQTRTKVLNNRF